MYNNYFPQTYPQASTTQITRTMGLKGRPVSSLEEVRATGIDFDGSIFFFPDLANRKIYTKQINLDGTAMLNMYELTEMPREAPAINPNMFITRDEFNAALSEIKKTLEPPKPLEDIPMSMNF